MTVLAMDELVAWLRGVLAEVEQQALQAIDLTRQLQGDFIVMTETGPAVPSGDTSRWDHMLADVAAKRAILDLHHGDFQYNPGDGPGDFAWTAQCQE